MKKKKKKKKINETEHLKEPPSAHTHAVWIFSKDTKPAPLTGVRSLTYTRPKAQILKKKKKKKKKNLRIAKCQRWPLNL